MHHGPGAVVPLASRRERDRHPARGASVGWMSVPVGSLDPDFSEPGAVAAPWADVVATLERAELYRVTTVRPDGRPHVTPLVGAWFDGALWFCTGEHERKGRNLAANPHVVLSTGTDLLHGGRDVVVEGDAVQVSDEARLHDVAAAFFAKYGEEWRFEVRDGRFHHGPGDALVYEVRPTTVFDFAKNPYSQTRFNPGG